MKVITVEPHKPRSARLEDIPAPDAHDGSVLVEARNVSFVSQAIGLIRASRYAAR